MKYRVLQFVGGFVPGQVVSDGEFSADVDFERLVRIGALEVYAGAVVPEAALPEPTLVLPVSESPLVLPRVAKPTRAIESIRGTSR